MDDRDIQRIYKNDQSPVTGAVVVPGLQAAITGALCGAAAGLVVILFKIDFSAIGAAAGVWILSTLVSWLSYRGRWQRVLELVMGVDLNESGGIGDDPNQAPGPSPDRITVELLQDGGRRGDFIDLPYPERLPALASGLLDGRQFSQTAWASGGQLYSRAEFETMRAELLRGGLIRWVREGSPKQGTELTPAGRAIMRRLCGRDDLPPPPGLPDR
jgi:hypothetical protein